MSTIVLALLVIAIIALAFEIRVLRTAAGELNAARFNLDAAMIEAEIQMQETRRFLDATPEQQMAMLQRARTQASIN